MSIFRSGLAALVLMTGPTFSHEFWISPASYVIENGAEMQADIRVGENFRGSAYSFNPNRFERFDLIQNDALSSVEGRLGDTPALSTSAARDTLAIVVHETTDSILTYTEWAKFKKFATHKDFLPVLDDHIARGLPQDRFSERYRRFAKSLIAVGNGAGADREVGLKTEIVALANPYTERMDSLPMRVLYEGVPRQGTQVELFERGPDGEVAVTLHRTDDAGEVDIPVKPGHDYLVDAVKMVPIEAEDPASNPVWYSLWAGLTFAVPQAPLE